MYKSHSAFVDNSSKPAFPSGVCSSSQDVAAVTAADAVVLLLLLLLLLLLRLTPNESQASVSEQSWAQSRWCATVEVAMIPTVSSKRLPLSFVYCTVWWE